MQHEVECATKFRTALTVAFGKPPCAAVMVSGIVAWRRAFANPLDRAIPVRADRPAVLATLKCHDLAGQDTIVVEPCSGATFPRARSTEPTGQRTRAAPLHSACPPAALRHVHPRGAVAAAKAGFHFLDPVTVTRTAPSDPETHLPGNHFNDATTDAKGRFRAGTMRNGAPSRRNSADSAACPRSSHSRRRSPQRTASPSRPMSGPCFSNPGPSVGAIFSAGYDLDAGTPHAPNGIFDSRGVRGRPDGGTIDTDGCH